MGGRGGGSPGRQSNAVTDWRDAIQTETILNTAVRRDIPTLSEKRQAQVERDTRDIVNDLGNGDWVRIARVRDGLSARGYSVGEQDAALEKLAVQRDVRVIPIANLKSLTPDDRRGALFIGGENKHAIMIARS